MWVVPFSPDYLFAIFDNRQEWYHGSDIAKSVQYYLWEFSNLDAPRAALSRLDTAWQDYYRGIIGNIEGNNILIFGTGLGTLPLMSLRRDRNIYACERYPMLSKLSRGVIQKYGLQNGADIGSIKSICKDPYRIKFPEDIPEKCDAIIFDDFDHTLLETGFVPILDHFRRNLLKPDARIEPPRVKIYAFAVELQIDSSLFDLSALEEYMWSFGAKPFDPEKQRHKTLSESKEILTFDFINFVHPCQKDTDFHINASGRWNAIVYWYELFGKRHYCYQYIDPITVDKDSIVPIKVYQQRTKIRFQTHPPLFIPRSKCLPSWHLEMINDSERNTAYHRSITKIMKTGNIRTLLDIGSGTGLLSLIAASANPDVKIYSCEIFNNLSCTAKETVKRNGYENQIIVINEDLLKLRLPEKVDWVICEVFDNGLIGEGVLRFVRYAKENLMKENARILPQGAVVKAMLIEHRTPDVQGINMSLTNPYRWNSDYTAIDLSKTVYRRLSDVFDVFSFDFLKSGAEDEIRNMEIPIVKRGIMSAVVFWFDLDLDGENRLSSDPFSENSLHWNPAIRYLPEIHVSAGSIVPLAAKHNGSNITYDIIKEKLAPDMEWVSTPRYDPGWVSHANDIECRYQRMILSTAENPNNYKRLIEAANRIASNPGNFDIRAKFATRLAESFYVR
ncbi:MAG TPA: methyltransferase [Deltaproteobacteria bacterium]|nr:methyltransferase [Deltaproteobacteria bacterium]